jgi:hypothetical protein
VPIIIDANRANDFTSPPTKRAPSIIECVTKRGIKIAIGGLLKRELSRTCLWRLIVEWSRSGFVVYVDDHLVEELNCSMRGRILSDDGHVISLAKLTRAKIIYSDDVLLIKDFRNRSVMGYRGRVLTSRTPEDDAVSVLRNHGG